MIAYNFSPSKVSFSFQFPVDINIVMFHCQMGKGCVCQLLTKARGPIINQVELLGCRPKEGGEQTGWRAIPDMGWSLAGRQQLTNGSSKLNLNGSPNHLPESEGKAKVEVLGSRLEQVEHVDQFEQSLPIASLLEGIGVWV